MELDELRTKWAEYDRKVDTSIRLNQEILKTTKLNRAQSALQRMTLGLVVEATIDFAAIVWLGDFIYEHISQMQFALPGIALDIYAIAIFGALIRQILIIQGIDYNKPITAIQKQMGGLRILAVRATQWTLLTSPLAWVLFMIVVPKGLIGLDVYRLFGNIYLIVNMLFGVGVILLAAWLSKAFSERMGRSPFIQQTMRALAGHSLNTATDFVGSLDAFMDETNRSDTL